MLFGYYEHTLDSKGRLVVPSKFRAEIGTKVYILKGFDGALSIFKEEVYEAMAMKLQQLHYNEANPRLYARLSYATTFELDIDKMGRVQIPSQLLTKYNISKDVVVIGVGDHIEVWDKQTYAAYEEKANQEFDNVAENLFKENE